MLTLKHLLQGIEGASAAARELPPQLAEITFPGGAIDSREIQPGELFVALIGERSDGHTFLAAALGRGARGALVRRDRVNQLLQGLDRPVLVIDSQAEYPPRLESDLLPPDLAVLIAVDEPLQALQQIGRYYRQLHHVDVVGITGSVGKTSTKEVTAAVLAQRFNTLRTPKSYNTESTVPLVMFQLRPEHQKAVIEMGTYGPGEIMLLCTIAKPKIGIVTMVGPSHLERMKTLETVALAKGELVESLPSDGWAILNYDDERVRAMSQRTEARVLTYGLNPEADLWADAIEGRGLKGIAFRAHYQGTVTHLQLPLLGRHSVHTALAAAAAGLAFGLSWDDLTIGLSKGAQLRLLAFPAIGGATVIDDTYNASPVSCIAALNLLKELDGRRIAIFGDMLELGPMEESGHRMVGERAADVVDLLIAVGERSRWIAQAAREARPGLEVVHVTSKEPVLELLLKRLQAGDYVLVKGGRAMGMDEIVTALQVSSRSLHE